MRRNHETSYVETVVSRGLPVSIQKHIYIIYMEKHDQSKVLEHPHFSVFTEI